MFDYVLRSNNFANKVVSEQSWWLSMAKARIEVGRFDGKGDF